MDSGNSIFKKMNEGFEMIKRNLRIYDESLNHRLKHETITLEDKRELIDKQIKKVQNSLSVINQNPGFYSFHKDIAKYYRDKKGLYFYLKRNWNNPILNIEKDCNSVIFNTFFNYEKLRYLEQLKNSFNPEKEKDKVLNLETEIVKDWILLNYLSAFGEIEKELFKRRFIDKDYKWKETRKKLIDFYIVIFEYGFFRPVIERRKKQKFHYRRFISERYGYGEFGLSESWKKYQPNLNEALIPFSWVKKPE